MKIIVCLKEVVDTSISLGYGQVSSTLMQKGLAYRLNPNDVMALAEALKLKEKNPGSEIILISIGPERVEAYLREGLASGADKAIRIWQDEFEYLSPYLKSRLLTAAVSLAGADLVLTGAKSLDHASGLTGPLIAAWLNIPCVCETIGLQLDFKLQTVTATRNAKKGVREKVLAALPVGLAVAGSREKLPYVSLESMLVSQEAKIDCLKGADLGISMEELKREPTQIIGLSFPQPRPKSPPFDSSLPAFYRILALLQGGISKRLGEMIQGQSNELADRIYDILLKEGFIKPAT
jgi:electron transfer flavoprotein beta subunit